MTAAWMWTPTTTACPSGGSATRCFADGSQERWRLIGAHVSIVVSGGTVRVLHAGAEVACHDQRRGRRERAVDAAHLRGIVVGDVGLRQPGDTSANAVAAVLPGADLLRPLAEYEQVAGGVW